MREISFEETDKQGEPIIAKILYPPKSYNRITPSKMKKCLDILKRMV